MTTQKMFFPVLLLLLLGVFFTACKKEELQATLAPQKNEINSRASTFTSSRDLMCTLGDHHCNPNPMGACLILFPPQGPFDQDIHANQARGLCFVNESNELSIHLLSDLSIEGLENTTQDFTLQQDFLIPEDVLSDINTNGTLPSQLQLHAGTYEAQVGASSLAMKVPTEAGNVNFVIWYNTTVNPVEKAGYLHNKWLADLVNDRYEVYNTQANSEAVHAVVIADMEAYNATYGLGDADLSEVNITGESTIEVINGLAITDYEKNILTELTHEVNTTDLFTMDGLTEGIRIINHYEQIIKTDENIVNQEPILGMLAVAKHSAMYWSITDQGDGTAPARMKKGWATALSDGIGFVKGFLGGGGWLGGAIRGVVDSAITYFTY